MNRLVEEARQRAREYKQAFLETGGREEDFLPTEIFVDYTPATATTATVSFVIEKAETAASYYAEQYFYNIDLESGPELTLRDMLGPDYIQHRQRQRPQPDRAADSRGPNRRIITATRKAPSRRSRRTRAFISTRRATSWWCSQNMKSRRGIWESRNSKFCRRRRGGLWFFSSPLFLFYSFPWY